MLKPGQVLYFGPDGETAALLLADGSLEYNGQRGSIHKIARLIQPGPGNGWLQWYYLDEETDTRQPIDRLRQIFREKIEPREDISE